MVRSPHRRLIAVAVVAIALPAAAAAPAARPAPAGFVPLSFTAVGEDVFWVLGSVPCARGRCAAIVRTTDGGRSFSQVHAPRLAVAAATLPELRFADRRDGFAYVAGASVAAGRSVLFATHDGGTTWRRLRLGDVLAFATARRHAYAVTARCSAERCTRFRLEHSDVGTNGWRARTLPFDPDSAVVDLAVDGSNVWVLGTPAGHERSSHDALARSRDGGRTFVTSAGPCFPDLGGALAPAGARVVWAMCPTGMLGQAWRSTDGGTTFAAVPRLRLTNASLIAPASRDVAVAAPNAAGTSLLRTTDGGRTWSKTRTPRSASDWASVGFVDATVGLALANVRDEWQLWRTTDGGASWSAVRFG